MASRMNGYRLKASQAEVEATLTVLSVAAGDITEEEFATWIREHAVKRK
jgi:death-on-curing protein